LEIRAKISLQVEKFKAGAATVGGIVKSLTSDAKKNSENVDKYLQKNLSTRIATSNAGKVHDMKNLTDFEKKMIASSKRMDKEAKRAFESRITNTKPITKDQLAPGRQAPGGAPIGSVVAEINARKKAQAEEKRYNDWLYKTRDSLRTQDILKGKQAAHLRLAAEEKVSNARIALLNKEAARAEAIANKAAAKRSEINRKALNRESKAAAFGVSLKERISAGHQSRELMRQKIVDAESSNGLSRIRYALYDVGQKALGMGLAVAAGMGQAIMESARFESAFTSVERTVGLTRDSMGNLSSAGKELRRTLLDLATTYPVSFEQIAQVATLGAQMGIAADSVDSFAETIVKFSAITGVSTEEAAQSFGRLGQLMDVPASKFENLSSAITYVGVNAVATDREILVMSESISAAASQAGFAADEVIGLAGALASLKVRPEEARGVIVRLFREIDASVSQGGQRLDDFAKTIGATSEEAKALWKSDPSQFFTSFLSGAKAAGDLNNTITALGITNSRELNVIQRLANNTDVLASTMRDAHEQYILGEYAGGAYAKVQDDLASKLTMMQNALMELAAAFGDSLAPAIKIVIDMLMPIVKTFAAMPGPLKTVLSLVAALGAGMLIFKGTMLISVASMLAMKTAMDGLGIGGVKTIGSLQTLRTVMGTVGVTGTRTAAVMRVMTFGFLNADRAARVAAVGTKFFASSMMMLQKALPIIGWIALGATVIATFADMLGNASNKSNALGEAMIEAGGGAEELRAAMIKDTEEFNKTGEALGKLTFQYTDAVKEGEKLKDTGLAIGETGEAIEKGFLSAEIAGGKFADGAGISTEAQENLNDAVTAGNDVLGEQTLALGRNTAAFAANALAKYGENQDKNFYKQITESPLDFAAMEAVGFNIADMIAAGMEKRGGAEEYVKSFQGKMDGLAVTAANFKGDEQNIRNFGESVGYSSEKIEALIVQLRDSNWAPIQMGGFFGDAAKSVDGLRASSEQAAASQKIQMDTLMDQGYSADAASDMVTGLNDNLKKYMETATSSVAAQSALLGSFRDLSAGLSETGNNMDIFTEDGRQNMANWKSYMEESLNAAAAAGEGFAGGVERISGALAIMAGNGVDTAGAFEQFTDYMATATAAQTEFAGADVLSEAIKNATSTEEIHTATQAFIDQNSALGEAGQAAVNYGIQLKSALTGGGIAAQFLAQWIAKNTKDTKPLAKEVKTLTDYASDLMKVFKEAIRFRFQRAGGFAQLQETIDNINDSIKEAKRNILDLQKSLSDDLQKRQDLQTDYDIALQFGDIEGAKKIGDELAALNADIAQSQEDLAYNVELTAGSLDLTTQAGRDNREALIELIESNAEYIQSLADSGASQATINKAIKDGETAFRAQARAMGIADADIDKYAKSFKDFSTIIKNVPRDVNVDANTDPARRALNDFIAEVNASKATVTVTAKEPSKAERKKALETERDRLLALRDAQKIRNTPEWQLYNQQYLAYKGVIDSGKYAQGGLVKGPGSSQSDSINARLSRDEYVMQASAVNRYGAGLFNALNNQQIPISAMGGSSMGGGSGVVYLSSMDRQLLQAAIDRPITLRTSDRVIAQSANNGNKELAKRGSN
jgi:TP901 family phage tail tape measure protein